MAIISSTAALARTFKDLGIEGVSISEVAERIAAASVSLKSLVAYLDALKAGGAIDDQTISGCPPADATKITNFLVSKGVVVK